MAGKSHIPLDVDLLKSLYFEQKKTTREIAKIVGASPKTVIRRLTAVGVKLRPPGPDHHMILKDRDWLYTQYVTLGKSSTEIAADIGSGCRTVVSWLEQHKIERRVGGNPKGRVFGPEVRQKISAAQKGKNKGSDNPNWRGGLIHPDARLRSSHQSREWSKEVRARDGHKCVECGATGKLHAHHIKPWKNHPELRWDISNGATLCPPCHQKAHGWRFPAWAYHGESRTSAEQA
jgi:5-methylcytosine-specific restriction endonuclease McrA